MLRGNYPTRTDEKGRLKVPADFKRDIDDTYGSTRFYSPAEWSDGGAASDGRVGKDRAEAGDHPHQQPDPEEVLEITNYYGQVVDMDAQGRLLLPVLLREKANLKSEVAVVGMLTYLEVRNMEAYSKQIEENPLTDEDANALSALGI